MDLCYKMKIDKYLSFNSLLKKYVLVISVVISYNINVCIVLKNDLNENRKLMSAMQYFDHLKIINNLKMDIGIQSKIMRVIKKV